MGDGQVQIMLVQICADIGFCLMGQQYVERNCIRGSGLVNVRLTVIGWNMSRAGYHGNEYWLRSKTTTEPIV